MAAQCCKLTDIMISQCDHLWTVPDRLIEQARQMNAKGAYGKRQAAARKLKLGASPKSSNNHACSNNNNSITCINNHTSSAIANVITNNGGDKIRINTNHIQRIML